MTNQSKAQQVSIEQKTLYLITKTPQLQNSKVIYKQKFEIYEPRRVPMFETKQMLIIGLIGEQQVGKTTLLHQHFHQGSSHSHKPTVAVQVSYCSYESEEGSVLRVKCWDTSGQAKYRNMICYHLKEADLVVFVFDLTSRASFVKIGDWYQKYKAETGASKVVYLIGNKADLVREDNNARKVSHLEAMERAKEMGAQYVEISAINQAQFQFLRDGLEQVLSRRALQLISLNKPNIALEKNSSEAPCQCTIF